MILRRLAFAVRQQDWFIVFVELFLIVAGVFLGIQVSNWNEARLDRQLVVQVIGRLIDEFRDIESNSLSRLSTFVRNTEELRSLASQLDETSENPDLPLLVRRLLAGTAPLPGGKSATYQELLSTGKLGIIQADGLRYALTTFATIHEANNASDRLNWDIAINSNRRLMDVTGLAIAFNRATREKSLFEAELIEQLNQDDHWTLQVGISMALHYFRHANETRRLAAARAVLQELGQEPEGGAIPEFTGAAD